MTPSGLYEVFRRNAASFLSAEVPSPPSDLAYGVGVGSPRFFPLPLLIVRNFSAPLKHYVYPREPSSFFFSLLSSAIRSLVFPLSLATTRAVSLHPKNELYWFFRVAAPVLSSWQGLSSDKFLSR